MDIKNIKILVVDDDAFVRDMLAMVLQSSGGVGECYTVETAVDGAEALETFNSDPAINLIISDMNMPRLGGMELIKKIRSSGSELPVIILTGNKEISIAINAMKHGASDYILKDENIQDTVIISVAKVLEKHFLKAQNAELLADLVKKSEELFKQSQQLADMNKNLEKRVAEKVAEVESLGKLKRFFSPQLADLIVAGNADDPLKSHRRDITVVFLDIRGFTTFADSYEPEEVMGVLREYHANMGELILKHEGTLERFTGDGMMIFFNDPVPVSNPSEHAIRMALEMQERFAGLAVAWHKHDYDIDLGIGIAKGFATLGAIGFEGRIDYGAIGSVTNLAARLCSEASPGQIIIAKKVLATVEDLVQVEPMGDLHLKGFHKPVPAFNVISLKET